MRPKSPSHRTIQGQVRIIAGQWRRQLLPVPTHEGLRPTGDRVRETVFNWLNHFLGGQFSEQRILDVFAGSGAFGLECVSRGARDVVLIDNHQPAVESIRKTLQYWQKQDVSIAQVRAQVDDALKVLAQLAEQNTYFDVIFLDPPFGQQWLVRTLPLISPLCVEDTLLYVEVEKGFDWAVLSQFGWTCVREGKTQQTLYGLWKRQ